MAQFVRHTSCENCGSTDAKAEYDDGTSWCFSCQSYGGSSTHDGHSSPNSSVAFISNGSYVDIPSRKLTSDTCRKYGYQVGTHKNQPCHIATYVDPTTRQRTAQKIRLVNKEFSVIGNGKQMPLYGQHIWGTSGKSVVITEGEIDCLSVAQAFGCKWPVVSLPNGASSVKQSLTQAYDWLLGFDKIVICFDADDAGRKATQVACDMLPFGRAWIMRLPEDCKDANDCLKTHGTAAIVSAYWNASQYKPDGIVRLGELKSDLMNRSTTDSLPYPWAGLNDKTKGIRLGELVVITAGSGLGKSTFAKEILYNLAVNLDQPVGLVFLEEQGVRTAEILVSMYLNKNILVDDQCATKDEISQAFDQLSTKHISLYSHFGSNDVDTIISKIRFMVQAEGIKYVFLDHISILVSASEGDERKLIDATMTKLRTLVSELKFSLFIISHLKRPQGDKGHEDGVRVSLGQLRGSHAIAQLADGVIGLEKDPDEPTADTVNIVILKSRLTGSRGSCGTLMYNRETGRLTEGSF